MTSSCEYLAGIIAGKMSELQSILNMLASINRFSEAEMHNMRERIDLIDASVRCQHRAIHDRRLQPKLNFYEQLLELTLAELSRRENHRGYQPPESDAMRARRLRSNADLDHYASDGRGEVPLEYWTTVEPAPGRVPTDANDLRQRLTNRREGRGWTEWDPTPSVEYRNHVAERHTGMARVSDRNNEEQAGPSGLQQMESTRSPAPRRTSSDDSSDSTGSQRTRNLSHMSARSRSSIRSYQSSRQQQFSRPQYGIALPPMLDELPCQLDRNDTSLVGRSEIYVQRPREIHRRCPLCYHDHRLIRCGIFRAFNLHRRWYCALYHGVCINCLRVGHSHFTCWREGACEHCHVRHNSLLCMNRPARR